MTAKKSLDAAVFSELVIPPPAVAEYSETQPECRLLWAVLQDGVETYMKYATATDRRGRRLFREVEEWIMHDDPTWLYSFVSICYTLGLDPDYIRSGLQRWRAGQVSAALRKAA
jgi:hypothetical protein